MKILIVDDRPRRYDRLMTALTEQGVVRSDVDFVVSTMDARSRIESKQYDLMILDILLPLWPEEPVDNPQHAIDLLFELHSGELINGPNYILGITADRSSAGDALVQFEDWCWSILDYSDINDAWVTRATNCVQFVRGKAASGTPPQRVDLAIVCALREPELGEVLKLPWRWGQARPLDDVTFVYDGVAMCGDRAISVCATFSPRMGMVSTALRSATLIAQLRPRIIAMTGICAGVRGKVQLGDVLFADPAWDFQSGKRVRDKENSQFSMRPHQLPSSAKIRGHIEQIRDDLDGLARMAREFDGSPRLSRVIPGPVASGSAVLADGQVIKEIREQHQELIGVEMEAYGLYAAAHAAADPQPLSFALKAVCDFADPDKEDGHQRYAAYASARVLQMLMERYGTRLLT